MEEEVRTWWIIRGKEKSGPYVRSELKTMAASGQLVESDHIWKEGLKAPLLASTMSGLEFLPAPLRPAAPPAPVPPPSPATTAGVPAQPASSGPAAPFEPYGAPATPVEDLAEEELTDEYGFSFEPSQVPANHGVNWIANGWRIFWQAPLLWGLTVLIWATPKYIAAHQLGSHDDSPPALPSHPASPFYHPQPTPDEQLSAGLFSGEHMLYLVFGLVVLAIMLVPVINAGMYALAHAVREEESPSIGHSFYGFTRRLGPLMMLGLLLVISSVLSVLVAGAIVLPFAGDGQTHLSFADLFHQPGMIMILMMGMYLAHPLVTMTIFLVLVALLVCAFWFATPLVFFQDLNPVQAMQVSARSCFRNFWPLLVYSLLYIDMYIALTFVQAIVVDMMPGEMTGKAVSFVFTAFWVSLLSATGYASFRDIFGRDD